MKIGKMNCDFSEEVWWQNLTKWIIDEGKIVTFKTMAGKQNVHVNMAKKMLATFYQEQHQEKISAYYMITTKINNNLRVKVVHEKEVKRTRLSLKRIIPKHIYALCLAKMDISSSDILKAVEEINDKPMQMVPLRAVKFTPKIRNNPAPKTQEKVEVNSEPKLKNEDKSNEPKEPSKDVNKNFLEKSGYKITKKDHVFCNKSEEEKVKKSASLPKSKILKLGPSKAKNPKSKNNKEQPQNQTSIKNYFLTRK